MNFPVHEALGRERTGRRAGRTSARAARPLLGLPSPGFQLDLDAVEANLDGLPRQAIQRLRADWTQLDPVAEAGVIRKAARAQEQFAAAGLEDLIELREGDGLETLAEDLSDAIDLVLLDGGKGLYPGVFTLLEGRLWVGALVISDDAGRNPLLERIRDAEAGFLSVPSADDVEISLRTA